MKSQFMERALTLAEMARGKTSPNPLVGAVIVKAGKIIAEGFHEKAGTDHAEIVALKKAKGNAKGSALYVNLEPCCHTGKTGPCTEAIIEAGIKKVVLSMRDPNPLVSGKGIAALKKAGITVLEGLLQKEAKLLNAPFEKFISQKLPYVIMKAACSLDGRIASSSGESKWISNEQSREYVHLLREQSDAIMVGLNTIIRDDPQLNVRPRKKNGKQPIRIVVDTNLKTPVDARIFHSLGGKIIVATSSDAPESRAKQLEGSGADILRLPQKENRVSLKSLMKELAKREIVTILLEGGSELYTDALTQELVDRVAIFYAPIILGGSDKYTLLQSKRKSDMTGALKILNVKKTDFGDNLLIEGDVGK
ncbi:MAG: bifunctional diaminohydroxyphosphoribosylaminopyrimidine deaminase/5-amino-6-(5-phosphoribosylamino)uracil reductase RibD [Nitrospinota bacterium]|nr:bifunctional diaminohydroxyphosphoribosylaminopyrimidine deaminase/5-amino-6-(5-phosphoribosylamino)uracil reductase RibD [Nitrospinota bacterium]